MEDQVFKLLMSRFDTLEEQNKAQLEMMADHIKESAPIHKAVERHSAYFGVASFGMAPILGWLAYKLGIKP
jgi:hypothetical protein